MDKMVEAYNKWQEEHPDGDPAQAFAAGFSTSAVSMRERAVKVAQTAKDKNAVINGIGSLPDIPA